MALPRFSVVTASQTERDVTMLVTSMGVEGCRPFGAGRWSKLELEHVLQHVLECGSRQLLADGDIDAVVDGCHRRSDALTDDALVIGCGGVQSENRARLDRLVDIKQGDR